MDIDKELREKVIETHTNVVHIMKRLEQGDDKFIEHEKRIRKVEQEIQFQKGKLAIIIFAAGTLITALCNAIIWLWGKLVNK